VCSSDLGSMKLGIGWSTIRNRVYRYGWTIEKALTTPVKSS